MEDNFDYIKYLKNNLLLEETFKKSILYASFTPEQYNKDFKSKGLINKPNQGSNGKTDNKNVILCIHEKESEFHNFERVEEYFQIKFEKSLDEIFLDYDDFDLDEFGIPENKQDNVIEEIKKYSKNKKEYPISNLIKYGLKFNSDLTWYGIYVLNIKTNEIKSIYKKKNDLISKFEEPIDSSNDNIQIVWNEIDKIYYSKIIKNPILDKKWDIKRMELLGKEDYGSEGYEKALNQFLKFTQELIK